jgi:oligopeptide transport system permease protein
MKYVRWQEKLREVPKRKWVGLVLVLQVLFLTYLAGGHYYVKWMGEEVRLKTAPIDPTDYFYGDYVILNYEISVIPNKNREFQHGAYNEPAYITLQRSGDFYEAVSISRERPKLEEGQKVIRGKVSWVDYDGSVRVRYGLDRQIDYRVSGFGVEAGYQFSWESYRNHISTYLSKAIKNKSLGETRFERSVEEELGIYFSRSFYLILSAFLISLTLGVLKGAYDYRHPSGKSSILGHGTTWLFQSIPDFFLVISFQIIVIYLMKLGFPKISIYGHEQWYHTVLPSILLAVYPTMYISRVTSSALAGEEGMHYIYTAQGKGVSSKIVLYKHMLGNCWGTILSHSASVMVYILSNLLIVEYLMFYRGAAYRLYEALGFRDAKGYGVFTVGHKIVFEEALVIGIIIAFMLCILAAQWFGNLFRHFLTPYGREG